MSLNSELVSACDRVVAAMANGLYQGIIIVVLVGLGLRVLGRTNAATRHAIWFATLALVAALIPAHCLRDYVAANKSPVGAGNSGTTTSVPGPASIAVAVIPPGANEPSVQAPVIRTEPALLSDVATPLASPAPVGTLEFADGNAGTREETKLIPQNAIGSEPTHAPRATTALSEGPAKSPARAGWFRQPISWSFTPGSRIPRAATLVLLVAWLAVGSIKLGVLLWRVRQLRKLKATAIPVVGSLDELFQRLRRELGVSRKVELKVSPARRSPVLAGFLRPAVLLSAEQPSDAGEAEVILRHELAHVRRRDDWANLVQHVIEAILFFHPGVWWISRQLTIQREIACDDYVLQQGGRARAYALLLTDLASRISTRRPLLAPGVTTSKSQLQKRIDMILNPHRDTSPRLAKSRLGLVTSAAALLAALAIYAAPRLVLAQAPTPVARPAIAMPPSPPDLAAPEALEADNASSSAPAAIAPGAKVKSPDTSDAVPVPVSVEPPVALTPPDVVVIQPGPAHAPYIAGVPAPAATPRPPKSPTVVYVDSSFEQRLRRLEKMVESLVEQKEAKDPMRAFPGKDPTHQEMWIDKEHIKQLQDNAKRDAERAAEQAKRAAKEAEKAMKQQQQRDAHGRLKENSARQLDALHKQREMLEREVEKVERQIEQLEQEQEKLQEEEQQRSELLDESADEADNVALVEQPCTDETDAGASAALAK